MDRGSEAQFMYPFPGNPGNRGESGESGNPVQNSGMLILMHPYRRSEPLGRKRGVKFHDVQGETQGGGPGDLEATKRGLVPVVQRFKVL